MEKPASRASTWLVMARAVGKAKKSTAIPISRASTRPNGAWRHREFRPVSDGRRELGVDQIGQDFEAEHCADAEGDVQRENAGDETQPTRNRRPATQQAVISDRRRYPHSQRVQRVEEREPRESQKKSQHDLTNVLGRSVGRAGTHSQNRRTKCHRRRLDREAVQTCPSSRRKTASLHGKRTTERSSLRPTRVSGSIPG